MSQYFNSDSSLSAGEVVPVGRPVEELDRHLLDDRRHPVANGEVADLADLAVRSRYLARGYWQRPELTEERFTKLSDGDQARLYLTGDLGRLRQDGNLELLGRADDRVVIAGRAVVPTVIEAALEGHDAVAEAAVVATQDIPGEPGLVAFVIQKVSPPAGADSLRQRLARTLPQSLIPTAFHVLPALPLDANGKVDRKRLVEENLVAFEIAPDAEPPEALVQQQLAEIWQELLQLDAVGIDQDFFDLGGTSLLAMHMFDEIESRLRVRLGPSLLLEGATILRLEAALLGKHDWSASLLPLQPNGDHPPLYFFHGDYIAGGLYCLELARQLG